MRRGRQALLVTMLALMPLGLGCGPERISEPEVLAKIDAEEAESLAQSLRLATLNCDIGMMRKHFDMDAVLRRGLLSSSLSVQSQRWLYDNYPDSYALFKETFCDYSNMSFSLVSIRHNPGQEQTSAVFSMEYPETDTFDYVEFMLGKDEEGRLVADDLYFHNHGWLLSEKFRDSSEAIASDFFNRNELGKVQQLLVSNPSAGMEAVKDLSTGYRDNKSLWLLMVHASAQISLEMNRETIRLFSEKFPGDASLKFITLDSLFRQNRYDEILSNLDEIERAMGGDAALDRMRFDVLILAENFSDARALVAKGIAADASDEDWHMASMEIDLLVKDYPAALKKLKRMAESFDVVWTDELVAEDMYPEFGQSEEWKLYTAWLLENGYNGSDGETAGQEELAE